MIWIIIYLIEAYVTLAWCTYDEPVMNNNDSFIHIIGSLLWPIIVVCGIPIRIYWWIKGK